MQQQRRITDCELDAPILLWLNVIEFLRQVQHLVESLKPEEWRLLEQHINAHGFGMTHSTIT